MSTHHAATAILGAMATVRVSMEGCRLIHPRLSTAHAIPISVVTVSILVIVRAVQLGWEARLQAPASVAPALPALCALLLALQLQRVHALLHLLGSAEIPCAHHAGICTTNQHVSTSTETCRNLMKCRLCHQALTLKLLVCMTVLQHVNVSEVYCPGGLPVVRKGSIAC